MGEIISLNNEFLKPGEIALFEDCMRDFLLSYLKNPKKTIVPIRKNPYKKEYILIDGNGRTAILKKLSEINKIPMYGWKTNSNTDFIRKLPKGFHKKGFRMMNHNIEENYNKSVKKPYYSSTEKSIENLMDKYEFMKTPLTMLEHLVPELNFNEEKISKLIKKINNL